MAVNWSGGWEDGEGEGLVVVVVVLLFYVQGNIQGHVRMVS